MKERFQTFTVLIAKISRNIKKIKNQEMAEYGLRSVHVTCLYYLYSSEALTATELCELCEEDKATISRGLVFLEENVVIDATRLGVGYVVGLVELTGNESRDQHGESHHNDDHRVSKDPSIAVFDVAIPFFLFRIRHIVTSFLL